MIRSGSLALASAVLASVAAFVPGSAPQGTVISGPGIIQNEPVVIYSLSGSTLTGTQHRQLTVYNSGFVTIAKHDMTVFPMQSLVKDVATTTISQQQVHQLQDQLIAAGARVLTDQRLFVSDVPLQTLTTIPGRSRAQARTFSYWIGTGEYARVSRVIGNFIQTTFPGF